MPNYTPNLNLEKPLATENYDVEVQNGNMDKVDTAIQAIHAEKAQPNGIATLGTDGKVPSTQLPTVEVPVTSVNQKTGNVVLTASDVGAAPAVHGHTISNITGLQSALDGKETPAGAQAKANLAEQNAKNASLPRTGGTITGDLRVSYNDIKLIKPPSTGGWARGVHWLEEGVSDALAGLGAFGNGSSLTYLYAGLGPRAWDSPILSIHPDESVRIKGNKVWHEGNDGSGSGLDADTLDGLHASSFLNTEWLSGFITNNFTMENGTTVTKTIPIGSGKTEAILVFDPGPFGVIVFATTKNTETLVTGRRDNLGSAWSRRQMGFVTNKADWYGFTPVDVDECYISGSNIVITYSNRSGMQQTVGTIIDWRVR